MIFDPYASAREIAEIAGYIAKTDYTVEDLLKDRELAAGVGGR
jgi:hypothetical protein